MLRVHDGTDHQKQFQAAVDVIQRLPKNGPYRPSYEVMLRFYSYYKQATVGRCNIPRPGFWDPIGRYKWDAWNGLGGLTQDEAMAAYIREMKRVAQKVIETVPMEETSSEMFHYFEPLYEVIPDMPRPPEQLFKAKTGRWDNNREANLNSDVKETNENPAFEVVPTELNQGMDRLAPLGEEQQYHIQKEIHRGKPAENGYILTQLVEEEEEPETGGPIPLIRSLELEEKLEHETEAEISQSQTVSTHLEEKLVGDTVDYSQVTSDSETEVFCDSLDQLELDQDSTLLDSENGYQIHSETLQSVWGSEPKNPSRQKTSVASQRVQSETELQCVRDIGRDSEGVKLHTEMNIHVTDTVRRLQEDMQTLQLRLSHLEAMMAAKAQTTGLCMPHWNITAKKPWWQSLEASGPTLLFLVLWPFFVQWFVHKLQSRKR